MWGYGSWPNQTSLWLSSTSYYPLNNETPPNTWLNGMSLRQRQRCHEVTSTQPWSADSLSKSMSDEWFDVAWFSSLQTNARNLTVYCLPRVYHSWRSRQMLQCMSRELSNWRTFTSTASKKTMDKIMANDITRLQKLWQCMCDHFPRFLSVEITHMLLWVAFQCSRLRMHFLIWFMSCEVDHGTISPTMFSPK